jgi:hypothetical protein
MLPSKFLDDVINTSIKKLSVQNFNNFEDANIYINSEVIDVINLIFDERLESEMSNTTTIIGRLYYDLPELDNSDENYNPITYFIDKYPDQSWKQAIICGILHQQDTLFHKNDYMSLFCLLEAAIRNDIIAIGKICLWVCTNKKVIGDNYLKLYELTRLLFNNNVMKYLNHPNNLNQYQQYAIKNMITLIYGKNKFPKIDNEPLTDPRVIFSVGLVKNDVEMFNSSYKLGYLKSIFYILNQNKNKEQRLILFTNLLERINMYIQHGNLKNISTLYFNSVKKIVDFWIATIKKEKFTFIDEPIDDTVEISKQIYYYLNK